MHSSKSFRFSFVLKWKIIAPLLAISHRLQVPIVLLLQRWGFVAKKPSSALVSEITRKSVDNLGDQAMIGGIVNLLRSKGIDEIGILTIGGDNDWAHLPNTHHAFSLRGFLNSLLLPWRMCPYQRFYYPGADVIDGAYSTAMVLRVVYLMQLADLLGLKTTVCGFSFNTTPTSAAVHALQRLPASVRLCCRDRQSLKRVDATLDRGSILVADVAFNLPPCENTAPILAVSEWIESQRTQGRQVLGVNVHDQLLQDDEPNRKEHLLKSIAALLDELVSLRQVSLVFVPHVYRPTHNDLETLRTLQSLMSAVSKPVVFLIESRLSACEAKSICGRLDLVLTGRMHLAIASLGMGTPVICITYQDKFEGLMQHFEIDGNTFSPVDVFCGDGLLEKLNDFLCRADELRQHILKLLPKVTELSKVNVE